MHNKVGCLLFELGACGISILAVLGLLISIHSSSNFLEFYARMLFGGPTPYSFYKYIFWAVVATTVVGLFLMQLYPPSDE